MANFQSTVLEAGLAKVSQSFLDKGEWRSVDAAAVQAVMKGGIADPRLADLRTAANRTVKMNFPIRGADGTGTGIAINHTGAYGDSAQKTISWSALTETFIVSEKMHQNNVYSASEQFVNSFKSRAMSLAKRSNAALIAQMIAAKTQVNVGGAYGAFNATNDDYEIPVAYKDDFFAEIDSMMQKNRYTGNYSILADTQALFLARKLGANGSSNANNTAYQMGNQEIISTTGAILTGGAASALVMPMDGIAYIPWIDPANRKGVDLNKVANGVGDFFMVPFPELGISIGVHAYSKQANTSAIGGSTQDHVTEYEMHVYWGFVESPLSETDASVIHSVKLLTT